MIKALVFDWGDTLMRDFPEYDGPMAYWPKVELMPNVYNSLKTLSNKYVCCAASNAGDSDSILMRKAFKRVGINDFIRYAFTSKELGFSKPDIRFFHMIVNKTGFKPDEIVMTGNDYEKDIKPAKLAGLHTIFYSKQDDQTQYEYTDYITKDIGQLIGIIS
ncbi:MAG: HAD family hydrolase [Crenarchaeota archaeon]|nr:HAD family hydrolase [Thermoproteota archaeon]